MKKIFQTFFIFLVFLTLSGCGFFGSSDVTIQSITTEMKDDKLYMVITYTDEFLEPSYFELARGEDGARGNGIAEILTDDKTKPGYTLVTVKYTDTSLNDEKFELPHGVSIENITVEPKVDAEGNPLLDENGEPTGEEELVITFTSGKEPIRIPYAKPQDGKDGREIELRTNETHIQWRYSGEDDEAWKDLITIESLKGEDGQIIETLEIIEENGQFWFAVYYENSILPDKFPITELKQPAQWHTGMGYPDPRIGKVGDFYLDTKNALIYKKESENRWGDPIVSFGSPDNECVVTLDVNGGSYVNYVSGSYTFTYGSYFYGSEYELPIPTAPSGMYFKGWYTTAEPKQTHGAFTDLTPIYTNIKLYAVYEPLEE